MTHSDHSRDTPLLYHELACLWPLISPPEDYLAEAELIDRIIHRCLTVIPGKTTLLELGAGGGHTLHHLKDTFVSTAVDVSDAMLDNLRRLNPSVRTLTSDMRSLELNEQFDVILLHDAVDYLCTETDIHATLKNIVNHLAPDGVAIIAPTYTTETFVDGDAEFDSRGDDIRELTYLSYVHDPDPQDNTIELILVYLIREHNQVRVMTDRHRCGLFSTGRWLALFSDAGLTCEPVNNTASDSPHTLFVCRPC